MFYFHRTFAHHLALVFSTSDARLEMRPPVTWGPGLGTWRIVNSEFLQLFRIVAKRSSCHPLPNFILLVCSQHRHFRRRGCCEKYHCVKTGTISKLKKSAEFGKIQNTRNPVFFMIFGGLENFCYR